MTFGENIGDHPRGLKAFRLGAGTPLFEMTRENSWAWDAEVIVLAKLAGMHVAEVPVASTECRGNRTPIRRLASDVPSHGMAPFRRRSELRQRIASRTPTPPGTFFGGSEDVVRPQDKNGALLR